MRGRAALCALLLLHSATWVLGRQFPKFTEHHDAFERLKGNVTSQYFTNEEMESFLHGMASECGDTMALFSIGTSGSGRSILALDVAQNPGIRDRRPFFHYIANMHGNEPSGRQLLLQLALHLCERRGDPALQRMLAGMHVIIVPTLNPDGFAARRRENRANVDLNRSFPDRIRRGSMNLTATGSEPVEALAVMRLATALPFAAGANMHEGALVANYPWDGDTLPAGQHAASPDDSTFRYLASAYATRHTRMSLQGSSQYQPVRNVEVFKGGITNGNAWYPVFGGMQDWMYIMGHCLEITLELWEHKFPSGNLLKMMWEENQQALLEYPVLSALGGLRGVVTGPEQATISFGDGGPFSTVTDRVTGAYARALGPGLYTVTVSAQGYASQTKQVTVPPDAVGVVWDVALVPESSATQPHVLATSAAFPYDIIAGATHGALLPDPQLRDGKGGELDTARTAMDQQQTDAKSAIMQTTSAGEGSGLGRAGLVVEERHQPALTWSIARWGLFWFGVLWLLYQVVLGPQSRRAMARRTSAAVLGGGAPAGGARDGDQKRSSSSWQPTVLGPRAYRPADLAKDSTV